jgi:hypothetical protein
MKEGYRACCSWGPRSLYSLFVDRLAWRDVHKIIIFFISSFRPLEKTKGNVGSNATCRLSRLSGFSGFFGLFGLFSLF